MGGYIAVMPFFEVVVVMLLSSLRGLQHLLCLNLLGNHVGSLLHRGDLLGTCGLNVEEWGLWVQCATDSWRYACGGELEQDENSEHSVCFLILDGWWMPCAPHAYLAANGPSRVFPCA